MHNTSIFDYFLSYSEHFGLTKHIKFHHKVLNVERHETYEETGRWTVTVKDLNSEKEWTEVFDGVLICAGHYTRPYYPQPWPGQDRFQGQIMHSRSYKDHRSHEDKVVAEVGTGNSGGDIATELSKMAKQVYLITRSGTWVLNRVADYGRPIDAFMNSRFYSGIRRGFPRALMEIVMQSQLNKRFDHAVYGLKPKHGIFGAHPAINDELPSRIASGTVRIKPQVASFTANGLRFVDGTSVEQVDTVILSTGYTTEFPYIEHGNLIKVQENDLDAYQFMFPSVLDHDTLALLGLVQPNGSIMPYAEMQARLFYEVLSGASKLPSKTERAEHVRNTRERLQQRYSVSRRHTVQVDYILYMDTLAAMVGHSILLSDPKLSFTTLFAPYASYFYRLRGPHAWNGARDAILTIEDRIVQATDATAKGSPFNALKSQLLNDLLLYLSFFGLLVLAWIH